MQKPKVIYNRLSTSCLKACLKGHRLLIKKRKLYLKKIHNKKEVLRI